MALVTIEEAKDQLNFDADVPASHITQILAAAEGYVVGAVGADLSDTAYDDESYAGLKSTAKQAILMLTAQWNSNRTGGEKQSEPAFGITALIAQVAAGVLT